MDSEITKEANAILNAFLKEFGMKIKKKDSIYSGPPYIDGKDAVLWMKERNLSWREVEWGGFFVKFLAQYFCEIFDDFPIEPYTRKRKYFIKGQNIWDVRLHNFSPGLPVILPDVKGLQKDLDDFGGYGIIVLFSEPDPDSKYEFLVWHDNLKGNPTEYQIRIREFEGKPPRPRKKGYFIHEGRAYYLTKKDFEQGILNGWMSDNFQASMRNSNIMPRNSKYLFHVDDVPDRFIVKKVNFNVN